MRVQNDRIRYGFTRSRIHAFTVSCVDASMFSHVHTFTRPRARQYYYYDCFVICYLMAGRVGFRVAYLVGFRVAYLVDAWSGSLVFDVAGFGFLVAFAEGDGDKPETRHRQTQSSRTIGVTKRCLV